MELSNQQIMFIVYAALFFYFNGLVLHKITGNLWLSYGMSFFGTNLVMYNILYAAREGNKYMATMEAYINDFYDLFQSEPEEDHADYLVRVGGLVWRWLLAVLSTFFEYVLPILFTPIYFSMVSGYRILGYLIIGPMRIFMALIRAVERLLGM